MKKFFLLVILCFSPLFLLAYISPGSPTGFVNDFAGLFSVEEKADLEQVLVNFEKESSNEISVVSIVTLGDESIEAYAVKLFEEWKIGKEGKDNGVLLLISRDDREMRIEVGYGLEGALTDALSSQIIRNIMNPEFREEKYYEGVKGALTAIVAATKGEYAPEVGSLSDVPVESYLQGLFFLIFFIVPFLISFLGMSKSWWQGGVIGGGVGVLLGLIFTSFLIGISSGIIVAILGLIFDFIFSKAYQSGIQRGRVPWWIGRGGRGGGFGGGFGGFGGGRSGGGGSSGRW